MKNNTALFPFILFCVLLALLTWTGLGLIVIYTKPTIGPRWLFFFFLFLASATTLLPLMFVIYRRIHINAPFSMTAPIRQSLMAGTYVDLLVWMQMGRVLDLTTAIFIFAVLAGVEVLIQLFDSSQWRNSPTISEEKDNEG